MDDGSLLTVLAHQDGVVSRAQVLACGGDDVLVARKLRRREWARVHEGVYVDHTGVPTWRQQAWAAVLVHAPAALAGGSALRAHGVPCPSTAGPGRPEVIEVVVDRSRRVDSPRGVAASQVSDFAGLVQANLSPPRVRVEHAAMTVASRARTDDAAVAVLAEVVRQRRTTPARLLEALDARPRLRRSGLLRDVVSDVADGAQSPLERRYLRQVERAHGLPGGRRQARAPGPRGSVYRDVDYDEHDVLVELDGRLGHEATRDRWLDLDRDLHALAAGRVTLRIGWGQVLEPCRLALGVGAVLNLRGWRGRTRACGPGCVTDQARIA